MKKTLLRIASCVLVATMLVGCAEKSETTKKKKKTKKTTKTEEMDPTDDPSEDPSEETSDDATSDPSEETSEDTQIPTSADTTVTDSETTLDPSQIMVPELEWCQVYNPNGFNTVTGLIYNPNSVAIDVTYDLVYYKNGQEVARNEQFSNFSIGPQREDVVWANWDIPNPEDVDEVKMENVLVDKAYYDSISGTINYKETIDNQAYFDVAFEKRPTVATIWFLFYVDENGNGKFDPSELNSTSIASTLNQTDTVSFDTDVFPYTGYEVYYNAY